MVPLGIYFITIIFGSLLWMGWPSTIQSEYWPWLTSEKPFHLRSAGASSRSAVVEVPGGACWYFRTGNRQGVRYGNFSCKTGWDIYDSWCLSLKSPLWLVNAMKHLWKHGMSAIFHPFSTSPCPSICLTTIFLGILQQLKVYHGPFHTFHLPSGKHTENYVTSSFLMGKSTINGHFQ